MPRTTHTTLSTIRFIAYLLPALLTFFVSIPTYAQSQKDIEKEWWYGAEGTEDLVEQNQENSQTVFDRWKERFDGDGADLNPDQLNELPSDSSKSKTGLYADAEGAPSKQSQFLEFLKKTDQSTPYAKDAIGAGKSIVNKRVIKPFSEGFEEGYGSPPASPPKFPQENKININKISPSDMTFLQRNVPKVKKAMGDPRMVDGGMEVLSTLQTIQHLIDCKKQGSDVRECAKTYILDKGTAKAVFEVLQLTGTATYGVFFSLAYADYVAIKNVMKVYDVTSAMWDDYEQARRQQIDNDFSDTGNWNGRLDKLEEITTLFEYQYTSVQEQIADELLISWADSDKKVDSVKKEVKPELKAALEEYRSQDYSSKVKEFCKRTKENSKIVGPSHSDCKSIIFSAASQTNAVTVQETYHPQLFKERYERLCQEELLSTWNQCTEELENIKKEASNPIDLEQLLTKYDEAEQSLANTEEHLKAYTKNASLIIGKLKNLTLFIHSRIDEIVWNPLSDRMQAIKYIEGLEKRIKNYKPNRMRFETIKEYQTSIQGMRSDLDYLLEIPKDIINEREQQLKKIEKYELKEFKDEFSDGCLNADKLAECIDTCEKFNSIYESSISQQDYQSAKNALNDVKKLGCPFSSEIQLTVPVPNIVGKTPTAAESIFQKHLLKIAFFETETPDAAEANDSRIHSQVPRPGTPLLPGGTVDAVIYKYNPDAPPTPCVSLKSEYKQSMNTSNPRFEEGQAIIDKASMLRCYWAAKAQNHIKDSLAKYEQFKKENAEQERICRELYTEYKEKMATKGKPVDFKRGVEILDQAEQCNWYDKARSHYAQSEKKYDQDQTEKQQKRCSELAQQFDSAVRAANTSLDSSSVKIILASASNCSWYSKAQDMMPCMDGEYKGIGALNNGDLETAEHWARWGKSKRCSYTDRLFSLVENEKATRKQQYCLQLADKATIAGKKADKTLDASELKSILASAQECSWYRKVSAMIPCIDGEHNALRAYNGGDLQTAASWTEWGKSNGCQYVNRVAGLINQQVAQRQQLAVQKKPGFWDTFGQELAKGLEDSQPEIQQLMDLAIQQHFQKKPSNDPNYSQPIQQNPKNVAPSKVRSSSQASTCAQLDSQLLAACNVRNVPLGESLYEQASRKGCELSSKTNQCINQYIDDWLDNLENDLSKTFNQDTFKVKIK